MHSGELNQPAFTGIILEVMSTTEKKNLKWNSAISYSNVCGTVVKITILNWWATNLAPGWKFPGTQQVAARAMLEVLHRQEGSKQSRDGQAVTKKRIV